MASKLLTVAALFVTATAAASPPVDTRRVTGNVSTEHQPPIDTCRVTGNILTTTNKGGEVNVRCKIEQVFLAVDLVTRQGDTCFADGTLVETEDKRSCQIETPDGPVLVPIVDPKAPKDA